VYAISVVGPLATVPQIVEIYFRKNVSGISLLSWSLYFLLTIPLILYAVVHKEKPLILMYSINGFFNLSVVIGIFVYR